MKTARVWLRRSLLAGVALLLAGAALVWSAPLWVIDHAVRVHLWREGVVSRYVPVDGERIHYLEAAPQAGAGRPLVLIHGLGAKAEDWAPMLPALAAHGFHVYAIDLLGYGRSAKPADATFSVREEERVVTSFMRAVGLERADVGGWSMGGWVALRLALDRPELVQHLVLYDAAGIYFPLESPETLFAPANADDFRALVAKLTTTRMPTFLVDDALRRFRQNGWVIRRSVASMTSGADLLDFRLSTLRRPTLIVWGAQDHLIPVSVGETLHRSIAGSSLAVLPGCGHLAPAECSRPALKATLEFLQEAPVERASGAQTVPRAERSQP